MIANKLYGKKVVNCYFAKQGHFGEKGTEMFDLIGFVTVYSNGFKTIVNGFGDSGVNVVTFFLLNKNNEVVETYVETY